jgi:predicted transcriptional regulator
MATKQRGITANNVEALRALHRVLQREGSASIEDWADEYGSTYGGVIYHKRALSRAGMITDVPGRQRSTHITDEGRKILKKGIRR